MEPLDLERLYSYEKFPIRGVFEEQTERIKSDQLTALEGLICVTDALSGRGLNNNLDYGSGAITTGGHARIPGLDMGEIISGNTRTNRLMSVALEAKGDIEGKNLALAADVGYTGWHQLEWNVFWPLFVVAQHPLELVGKDELAFKHLEDRIETGKLKFDLDQQIMIDGSLPREIRFPEFQKLSKAIAWAVLKSPGEPSPVSRMLHLLDATQSGGSLGVWLEGDIADTFKIPRFRAAAMRPADLLQVADELNTTLPTLSEDIRVLTAHGAELVVECGSCLTLVRA